MNTCWRKESGFTLIELMVVIVLIGILASIGLQFVEKAIDKTRVNSDISQGRRLKEAIDVFYTKNGKQPDSLAQLYQSGFISPISSAQKYSGSSVKVDDSNYGTNPIFQIDLTTGNVIVKDVTQGSSNVVWDSGSI